MKKYFLLILGVSILIPSCVSQKKYAALEAVNQQSKDLLNTATVKLNACIDEKAVAEAEVKTLKEQVTFLSNNNQDCLGYLWDYSHQRSPKSGSVFRFVIPIDHDNM